MNEVDTHAAIADLLRRVGLLEQNTYGHASPQVGEVALVRRYRDAHKVLRDLKPDNAAAWVATTYLWDVRALVTLGRQVNDPYPFRPLLMLLDRCVLVGAPGAAEARTHLEAVSQDLMNALGLELLTPRDVMGRLALQQVTARLRAL